MTSSTNNITNLLIQTAEIFRRYDEIEKVAGNQFNLLGLLGVGHYEERTHTPILTDLLNPKGSHGQGALFLELFLQHCFGSQRDFMKRPELVTVKAEHSIGPVDYESAVGGRIDIHLHSPEEILVIENKIGAAEGHKQVERYLNYIDHQNPKRGAVIYLTLGGEEPESAGEKDSDNLHCLSYHSDIISWLRLCRKEVATIPIVRESLTIYLNLISKLTNQSPYQKMNEELTQNILSSPESLKAFLALENLDIRGAIFESLKKDCHKLAEELSLQFWVSDKHVTDRYFGFSFRSASWKDFEISFNFDAGNCGNLYFGFYDDGKMDSIQRSELHDAFIDNFGSSQSSSQWCASQLWTTYQHWKGETLLQITHGPFLDDLAEKVRIMSAIANQITK